jgi:hypothetical protein
MCPVVDARERTTLVFLALAAVASTACGRTALGNPGSGSGACGDEVLEGYLVDGDSCGAQALPRLPAYQSKNGLGCYLDVYLSRQVPANAVLAACSGEPVTSKCFLEATGFTGFIENASTGIAEYPRAALIGSMQTANVCTPIAKCASVTPACEECQQRAIFVPCQVSVE